MKLYNCNNNKNRSYQDEVKEIDKNAHEEHGAVSSTGPYSYRCLIVHNAITIVNSSKVCVLANL